MQLEDCQDCSFLEVKQAFGRGYLNCGRSGVSIKKTLNCPESEIRNQAGDLEINSFDDFHDYPSMSWADRIAMGFWLATYNCVE